MNISAEQAAQTLQAELGGDSVTLDPGVSGKHAVDGKTPLLVCAPAAPEQVATVLRICAEARVAVTPWGGGTGTSVGNAPREMCVVMDLTRLNRVIDHDHANLTVAVESGATLANLQEALSRRQQFLPFDAPRPAEATIGGTVALNLNGPRRASYGSIRDLVIGMKVTLSTGEQIKAGGKVVKNVAGYDMCKLFVGSLGTLGVITEVTSRVAPAPESAATAIVSGDFNEVEKYIDRLSRSPLLPAAVILTNSQPGYSGGKACQVALWSQGLEETVARHLSDAQTLARQFALGSEVLRGGNHDSFWEGVRDFPLEAERCVFRATVPRAEVTKFIEAVNKTADLTPALMADMVFGTVWLSWPVSERAAATWRLLMSLAASHHGHAVMFSAPHQAKEGIDIWGPPPATLSLMRGLKERFDPLGLLNPGRFVGGI
jgi:glycolate oxidase FAD binding subunit